MDWRRFVKHLVGVFAGGSMAIFALLALLDPWGTLPFRSPLPRVPADHSQRWAYPELARETQFDAAVIGSSTSRLLDPAALDPAVGARFVNLAIVSGAAFEEARLLDVFMAAHPTPRAVLVGLDRRWCERGDDLLRFGYDPIPEFLYADRAGWGGEWRALGHLFNIHAFDTAWRSLRAVLGLSPQPYGANGYTKLEVDFHTYDPTLARALIAQHLAETWLPAPTPDPASWRYVALEWLGQRLDRLPAETRKLLVFVPVYHLYPAPGSVGAAMMEECKNRAVAMARERPGVEVYDMSFPNPITTDPERWWDGVHGRPETLAQVSRELAAALADKSSDYVRVLVPRAASVSSR